MVVTATKLRQNLYKLLDQILETGVTIEIHRKGKMIKLVPEQKPCNLDNLVPHPGFIVGDPEDLVHIDWSKEWKPFI